MTFQNPLRIRTGLTLAACASLLALAACASMPQSEKTAQTPDPVLPTEQYPLRADAQTDDVNLRVNPNGLSENQRRALDRLASRASWTNGEPVSLDVVTGGSPTAVAAGRAVSAYLMGHDVSDDDLSVSSRREQPDDVISIHVTTYSSHLYGCNKTWENLSATRDNKPYKNFGCAINSNLAAQIADPRDIDSPAPTAPADAARKSVVLDKYRKGEKTSSESDDNAKGNVSEAIK
ncbi:CpaD family pilus assembly protein [Asticcacaulis solisilvae]|uniref:CpaD family pilus assembly protein n=1 Tax=Asticcacaulis solisilvae TaxID=1217274 RepID=UPI003FD6C8FE